MSVAELTDVTFAYDGVPAVEDVTLRVEAGDFLGLVGPNGSGKSTLLKLLLGVLRPDEGTVSLFDEPAHAFSDGTRVGYVAQETADAASGMPITVREVVTMGRYPHAGFRRLRREDRDRIADAMETVGVSHLADRRLSALSGGQRQRVFIARALAADAELLALDEPTVGVDAESREAFFELLRDLNDEGLTIVLIEHDIGVVTAFTSKIACINRQLFFHGDSLAFSESDALREAYGANQRLLDHHDHDH
jgi:zinc transport system ATP-binding protein